MQEKILSNRKNGMAVLLLTSFYTLPRRSALYSAAFLWRIRRRSTPLVLLHCMRRLAAGRLDPLSGAQDPQAAGGARPDPFRQVYRNAEKRRFYFVNPFCSSVNPAAKTKLNQSGDVDGGVGKSILLTANQTSLSIEPANRKISLKIMTLNNNRQKINDCLGNPVEIGIAVMWRVVDTAKAVFNVDNYKEYLSLQCDSALRNIVRIYPYDVAPNVDTTGDGVADEGSLRGSSEVVASRIRDEIQQKVGEAGLEILEARITYLAYAPEIAAVMLQRQQASAIIDARKMIVDGAVGMVEMALERLSENRTVELDEERKAAMVSNLLVVLCGNHDAQPVVNSGSLY